jgi:hypothetical protein
MMNIGANGKARMGRSPHCHQQQLIVGYPEREYIMGQAKGENLRGYL